MSSEMKLIFTPEYTSYSSGDRVKCTFAASLTVRVRRSIFRTGGVPNPGFRDAALPPN